MPKHFSMIGIPGAMFRFIPSARRTRTRALRAQSLARVKSSCWRGVDVRAGPAHWDEKALTAFVHRFCTLTARFERIWDQVRQRANRGFTFDRRLSRRSGEITGTKFEPSSGNAAATMSG